MRPRFRLWDRKSGERIDAMTPGFGFALAEYLTGSLTFNHDEFKSLVIVEQSTGLLDEAGREIYEGDILRWTHGPVDIGVVEYRAHDEFGNYPNAAFYGLLVPRLAGLSQFQSDDTYEILGNIHEHPHLLSS